LEDELSRAITFSLSVDIREVVSIFSPVEKCIRVVWHKEEGVLNNPLNRLSKENGRVFSSGTENTVADGEKKRNIRKVVLNIHEVVISYCIVDGGVVYFKTGIGLFCLDDKR